MDITAVVILLIFAVLMVAVARLRVGDRVGLRPLPPKDAVLQQVSRAVESGGSLHVSLGTGGVGGTETMSSLAGAAVLDRLADQSASANVAPLVTIADATLLPVAQNSLRRAYVTHARSENYDPNQVLLLTPQPLAYAAAAGGVAQDRGTSGNVFVGSFGSEVVLLAEAAARSGTPQVAGAAEPQAQALLYPLADQVLFGEEIFAAGAYMGEQGGAGRLFVQDVIRALVVAGILIYALVLLVPG